MGNAVVKYILALFGLAGAAVNVWTAPELSSKETVRAIGFAILAVFFFMKAREPKKEEEFKPTLLPPNPTDKRW